MNLLQTLNSYPRPPLTYLSSKPLKPCSPFYPELRALKPFQLFAISATSDSNPKPPASGDIKNPEESLLKPVPGRPRRGRKSEADKVEDHIRATLGRTFEALKQQNAGVFYDKEDILKDKYDGADEEEEEEEEEKGKKMMVEEEASNWPLDGDIGWGTRASEYFDKHPIRNVVGEDGVEIDWVAEMDDNYVNEINSLEWESFAFRPSPMIVLVFERYNRATYNWKLLKELEKAIKVYWAAKDRLPPRTVKIDINIERDLAYALKVKECPEILFLKGNTVLYREKEFRSAEELIKMIAHFYYNAKKPSWIDDAAIAQHSN